MRRWFFITCFLAACSVDEAIDPTERNTLNDAIAEASTPTQPLDIYYGTHPSFSEFTPKRPTHLYVFSEFETSTVRIFKSDSLAHPDSLQWFTEITDTVIKTSLNPSICTVGVKQHKQPILIRLLCEKNDTIWLSQAIHTNHDRAANGPEYNVGWSSGFISFSSKQIVAPSAGYLFLFTDQLGAIRAAVNNRLSFFLYGDLRFAQQTHIKPLWALNPKQKGALQVFGIENSGRIAWLNRQAFTVPPADE